MPTTDETPALTPSPLAAALCEVQKALPHVHKSKTAIVPTKAGGKYTYTYADLSAVVAAVHPLLAAQGLAFTACPTLTDDGQRFVLRYTLAHTSGDAVMGEYPLPDPARATAQEVGSAITYARRYTLCAVTGVVPDEDDDGAAAPPVDSRPEWHYRTLDLIAALDPEDRQALREWAEAEGLPRSPDAWTEDGARRLRERAHQITGR